MNNRLSENKKQTLPDGDQERFGNSEGELFGVEAECYHRAGALLYRGSEHHQHRSNTWFESVAFGQVY